MTNVYELPAQDQRYDEASTWIAKLDKEMSASEQHALQEWMAADPQNLMVLMDMARLWDNMTVLSRLSDLFPETQLNPPIRSTRIGLAIAASILTIVVSVVWLLNTMESTRVSDAQQDIVVMTWDAVYETAIGEQSTVVLKDGSQVILNTNSLLKVDYTDQHRLLRLENGEIHVDVVHNAERPLTVLAVDKIVQAIGTAFSVEITSEHKIELVVTEGKVLVGVGPVSNDITNEALSAVLMTSSSVIVEEGEELILGSPDEEVMQVSPEEIEVKLSWRHGNLIFRGESLEDAVTEIGRYTTVEFVILDDELKKVRIAGLFRAGDVDGLLATLRQNFNISYQRTNDGKILLTRLGNIENY